MNTVTQEQIESIIKEGKLETRKVGEKTTSVTLTTKDGFEITETSACIDVKNYDAKIGYNICLERIENKLWELEGYVLQKELYKKRRINNGNK